MTLTILSLEIRFEQDVVMTRQRTRQIAELLGFDPQDQTRIATAVSEISRNAFQYAGGGKVEFCIEDDTSGCFLISVRDKGHGIPNLKTILDGQYTPATGMGLGIIGTQRLMDQFHIESVAGQGTTVLMGKNLPRRSPQVTKEQLGEITDELIRRSPQNPLAEIQQQNQELLRALEALRQREEELIQLNRELEDTNRGVVSLYAELDEKADSLQKANELKTRFLSNMSHEFRTPLNSIVSLSSILLDRMDGELTLEQEKQVTFIRKAAESLSDLVNDLLDLAKVEAGKIVVYPNTFEVSDLFATLRGMLRPLLVCNSSIALIFDTPIGIPTLQTDEGKVAQILRNFISNSLKYTEQGEVRVSAAIAGDSITFSVRDTGIGIADEYHERIFEEYVQIDSPLQKRTKGTGLGLPLSRQLAQLLGGSVSVTSNLGVGSTFLATIPITYPGLILESSESNMRQLDPTRLPILVVEDHAETIFTYQKYFEGSIYQIISAETIALAKQALLVFKPIAMVLDILLQQQHTWTFLSEMKENTGTQDIPILVTTVVNNQTKAIALGANAFLIKPVEKLQLLNTLNCLVRGNKQQTLLLVDDDPMARYLLKDLLSDTSFSFLEATDGIEGISLATDQQPSCIILDFTMPKVSGVEVLDQLKSDPKTAPIPVIIHTSQVLDKAEQENLAKRTVAIISKKRPSRTEAIAKLQSALIKAGLAFDIGINHA